jgi:NAD(P)H dehydrogenase (quinone)
MTIVVTGASGHLGRLVVAGLLDQGVPASQIVAAVRTPAKAAGLAALGVQVREADYDRPQTVKAALADADRVLLISGSEPGRRLEQHQAVISAARDAGVSLLAYTSIVRADTSPLLLAGEHQATEEAIAAAGLPFAFLRNGWYFENYGSAIAHAAATGTLTGGAGPGRVSAASRADFAAAAVAVLARSTSWAATRLGPTPTWPQRSRRRPGRPSATRTCHPSRTRRRWWRPACRRATPRCWPTPTRASPGATSRSAPATWPG